MQRFATKSIERSTIRSKIFRTGGRLVWESAGLRSWTKCCKREATPRSKSQVAHLMREKRAFYKKRALLQSEIPRPQLTGEAAVLVRHEWCSFPARIQYSYSTGHILVLHYERGMVTQPGFLVWRKGAFYTKFSTMALDCFFSYEYQAAFPSWC